MIRATRPEMASYEEYIEEIKSIWDEGAMTNNGPKVRKLKDNLLNFMNCQNTELFVNGHTAMLIALKSLDLPVGGEVITSPFTFISTTNAIIQCGLTPVFCDIDETYNIDIESLKRNITKKTCAIVTPHIFGIPCHIEEIEEIANEYELKVVYDAAQAFGTKVKGKNIGCFGDVTMFSLHAIKVYNAVEGGILTFKDSKLKEKLELYRNFGISYGEVNDVVASGINGKMTEFSAAMGLVNLRHVDEVLKKRKQLAEYYIERIAEIDGIQTFPYQEEIDYNYAYFPVKVDSSKLGMNRDEVWKYLQQQGIQTRKLYDCLTCDFSIYKNRNYRCDVENARRVAQVTLDLPMYSELEMKQIDKIVTAIINGGSKKR